MKGEYWNTDPYCYCANSAWGKVDGIRDIPVGGAAVTGLSGDDTAALAAGLIGLAALLPLLLCILCCLCPPGLCYALCPCLAACCGKKKAAAAAAGGGAGAVAGGAGAGRSDKLREVDIKLPRAWVESFRGVPVEDFDNKLKALEASGWVGLNDGYGSWFGDDANSMSTLLKGSGTGGYKRGTDEVDGYKKGHNRMASTYLTSEEIFGTTKTTTSGSAGDHADKKRRDYEYGSVISAKYGDEMRGESEADLDRSTTTLLRNPSDGSSGGVYNYGFNRNEEITNTNITTHMSSADQEKQRELMDRQEKLQYQQEQLLIQQQAALLAQQNAELNSKHNSGMNEISEMSLSTTVANEGQTVAKPMSSKVIYEATRETRTVTDESGNVSKTHSETKNGDGAKVIGVISKNGTFRRVKGGEVEYMTQDDIKSKDVKCLTSENVMKLYQSYQRSRSGSTVGSKTCTNQKALEGTDNVSL